MLVCGDDVGEIAVVADIDADFEERIHHCLKERTKLDRALQQEVDDERESAAKKTSSL